MYFLDGDRLYIKPECGSSIMDEQIYSCLQQIIKTGKRIYNLVFFADVPDNESYKILFETLKERIAGLLGNSPVFSLISQAPLDCSILAEISFSDSLLWHHQKISCEGGAGTIFKRDNSEVITGYVQSNLYDGCRKNSEHVFLLLGELLEKGGMRLKHIIRQWNYIENILGFDNDKQRYQEFNEVRAEQYSGWFDGSGFPAATGIGMNCGGVIVEFVAVKSQEAVSFPLDNPEQTAAYCYSGNVLVGVNHRATPRFERARYLGLFDKKMLLVSGTASIRGENTVGVGNPAVQTHITIKNMQHLFAPGILQEKTGSFLQPVYGHARVYVKNRYDFGVVKETFESYYNNLPVVYLLADICRNDLLVEIEGKVILE